MDSAAVLTDQQRLLRFRKVIEQKKFRKNLTISKTEQRKRRSKSEPSTSTQKRVKEVTTPVPIVDPIIFNPEPPAFHEEEEEAQQHQVYQLPEQIQLQHSQDLQLHKLKNSTEALQRKIASIVQCHEITFAEREDIFFEKLDNISDGNLGSDISREEFLSYIRSESENFRKFALLHKYVYHTDRCQSVFIV
jgi:hypothetical protein